jgi:CheY-like chemotaxis protein
VPNEAALRILVVDDEAFVLNMVKTVLSGAGWEVRSGFASRDDSRKQSREGAPRCRVGYGGCDHPKTENVPRALSRWSGVPGGGGPRSLQAEPSR